MKSVNMKNPPRGAGSGIIDAGADFSPCRNYRYRLWRRWSPAGSSVLWLMLNPSRADERHNDATIRRCIAYSQSWGYAAMDVCNLFAWCATHPRDLFAATSPVGRQNDNIIRRQIRCADLIMAAWGVHGDYRDRAFEIMTLLAGLDQPVYCLGTTRKGAPKHPLRLAKTLRPVLYHAPPQLT
jgi:hypothetical protein